jgi:small subunit ribosomal protein S12
MLTKNQNFFKFYKKKKAAKRAASLYYKKFRDKRCPQLRGIIMRLRIVTPKKPNSARRPAAKTFLSNDRYVVAHIPGIGHNLRKHSETLIRGGGARDLPGVRYSCVRGAYGLSGVLGKLKRRSIYGTKRPDFLKKKLRRKYRKLFT